MNLNPNKNNEFVPFNENETSIGIRQVLEKYFFYWKWFLLAVVISLALALVYLRYATKEYAVNAQILLKEKETTSPELAALSDAASSFMGNGSNAVVNDQIKILQSRRLIYKTVLQHRLNVQYFNIGNVNTSELLAEDSQGEVHFIAEESYLNPNFIGEIEVHPLNSTQFKIVKSDIVKTGTYIYGATISSELGSFKIVRNDNAKEVKEFVIKMRPLLNTVEFYRKKLQITSEADKNSMIVNFSLVDNLKDRAVLIVNSLIYNYNQDSKEDGSKLAEATSAFINERLDLISADLKNVDKNLADYKTTNKLNNTEMESGAFLQDVMAVDKQVVELSAQLQVAQHLIATLQGNKNVLLPSNVGIQDPALSTAISNYNQLVLEKQEYAKSMRNDNPAMETLNKNIADVREGIQGSLRLYQNNLQSSLKIITDKKGTINEKLTKLPAQELGFRNIARQQQIVEAIYLFLLEKREEAEIKSSATVDVVKIVDNAYGSDLPVNPKSNFIYLIALLLGVLVPFGIIYVKLMLNNTIKDKTDFKGIFDGAFLGDIPTSEETIIAQNDRSSLAEAFRIIRSNLNFVLPKITGGKAIFVTSTVSGEGKTFTAVNLAQILALTKKKVVLLGADVRAPKVLEYLNLDKDIYRQGLTDLIVNEQLNLEQVLAVKPNGYLFDVVPSGSVPPNPSELLMDEKMEALITELKSMYDYVIVDTAPVGMVSDTQIIADNADATLYIARSNYLDKRLTSILQDMQSNKKLKNIALIINDVDYNRGYGYGYGYGYGDAFAKKKWYKRRIKKV